MLFGGPERTRRGSAFPTAFPWLLPAMDSSPSMWMPGGVLIAVVRVCTSFWTPRHRVGGTRRAETRDARSGGRASRGDREGWAFPKGPPLPFFCHTSATRSRACVTHAAATRPGLRHARRTRRLDQFHIPACAKARRGITARAVHRRRILFGIAH